MSSRLKTVERLVSISSATVNGFSTGAKYEICCFTPFSKISKSSWRRLGTNFPSRPSTSTGEFTSVVLTRITSSGSTSWACTKPANKNVARNATAGILCSIFSTSYSLTRQHRRTPTLQANQFDRYVSMAAVTDNETELIRRAQADDANAFSFLAERYARRIYLLAFHYCCN